MLTLSKLTSSLERKGIKYTLGKDFKEETVVSFLRPPNFDKAKIAHNSELMKKDPQKYYVVQSRGSEREFNLFFNQDGDLSHVTRKSDRRGDKPLTSIKHYKIDNLGSGDYNLRIERDSTYMEEGRNYLYSKGGYSYYSLPERQKVWGIITDVLHSPDVTKGRKNSAIFTRKHFDLRNIKPSASAHKPSIPNIEILTKKYTTLEDPVSSSKTLPHIASWTWNDLKPVLMQENEAAKIITLA